MQASDNLGRDDDHLPPGEGILPWRAVIDSLEDVVTMRYEFRSEDLAAGWEAEVDGPPEVIAWISAQLASYGAGS